MTTPFFVLLMLAWAVIAALACVAIDRWMKRGKW